MKKNIDYRAAGVDIAAGESAVQRIRGLARSTFGPAVLDDLGGFGGLYAPDLAGLDSPVLVAGCDGVGTKLKVAFATGQHHTVGIDCVAMCVNDILVQGARPLFFLDYLALGRLEPALVEKIISGVAAGCREAGCALLGGETAEMPGFYPPGEYDLAGFAVGLVDRARLIDGSGAAAGDVIIGLASAGLHSNGFSLVRRVLLERANLSLADRPAGLDCSLGEELLRPTRLYVQPVLEALKRFDVRAMAHITGGGLPGNLPRCLPAGLEAEITPHSWPEPPVFKLIARLGPVEREEMFRVFNMGLGFALVVPPGEAASLVEFFQARGQEAYTVGRVTPGGKGLVFAGGSP